MSGRIDYLISGRIPMLMSVSSSSINSRYHLYEDLVELRNLYLEYLCSLK
uniref:Uncharacterized protein n=1 Tax=Utricularia reniformis TaxID=192314 RepID=A0A1Y0B1S3_9LAMI|nr:hypothetical protein AEK19_MT1120 [Utricularia reniformis]ART31337.1 hypothetical protein AEK19_MT1120 [Utricularia reniformis]